MAARGCEADLPSPASAGLRAEIDDARETVKISMVQTILRAAQRGHWGAARYWLMTPHHAGRGPRRSGGARPRRGQKANANWRTRRPVRQNWRINH